MSSRAGMPARAPAALTDSDPAALAAWIASSRLAPPANHAARTPQKVSPAPVVSTTVAAAG